MKFEFAFRTYNSFIPSATLHLAGIWLESRLAPSYGGSIESIIVEPCCKNVSPPKKSLERLNATFEDWIKELPFYELTDKGKELRICYHIIKYTHDEVTRDNEVLSVKTFQQVIAKSAQLVEATGKKLSIEGGFDAATIASDLRAARSEAPINMAELIELYNVHCSKEHT